MKVELAALPAVGMHFLQVQNPDGLFSNDFIFHVTVNAGERERPKVAELRTDGDAIQRALTTHASRKSGMESRGGSRHARLAQRREFLNTNGPAGPSDAAAPCLPILAG